MRQIQRPDETARFNGGGVPVSPSFMRFVVSSFFLFLAACSVDHPLTKPDLPPDLSGAELRRYLSENPKLLEDPDAVRLEKVLAIGKRNLDWLIAINDARAAGQKLSLSSKDQMQAFPIESPREYSPTLVLGEYDKLIHDMPKAMSDVLLATTALPHQPTLDQKEYLKWGRATDLVYQLGVRWLTLKPWIDELRVRRRNDIRGFYYLSREKDLETNLDRWASLPADVQRKYRDWLVGVCANTDERVTCGQTLDQLISSGARVRDFWTQYSPRSKAVFDGFFTILPKRADILWTATAPLVATIPFVDPQNAAIADYLKKNVEDEWRWQGWQLAIRFENGDPQTMSHIVFKPGTTPNVDMDKGEITMDANQPTSEYESQWTIRHEFGHVLGFPDCYLEFFDDDRGVMLSYQIDITNLMCSRRGALKQTHFDEMKRVYFHAAPR